MKIKLTYDQIEKMQKSGFDRWLDTKPKPVRNWTLEDLAKGKMFSPSMLQKCLDGAKRRKDQHRDYL